MSRYNDESQILALLNNNINENIKKPINPMQSSNIKIDTIHPFKKKKISINHSPNLPNEDGLQESSSSNRMIKLKKTKKNLKNQLELINLNSDVGKKLTQDKFSISFFYMIFGKCCVKNISLGLGLYEIEKNILTQKFDIKNLISILEASKLSDSLKKSSSNKYKSRRCFKDK